MVETCFFSIKFVEFKLLRDFLLYYLASKWLTLLVTVENNLLVINYITARMPTLCFKKVWKLRQVFNVRVTAGHMPAKAQEEPDG